MTINDLRKLVNNTAVDGYLNVVLVAPHPDGIHNMLLKIGSYVGTESGTFLISTEETNDY